MFNGILSTQIRSLADPGAEAISHTRPFPFLFPPILFHLSPIHPLPSPISYPPVLSPLLSPLPLFPSSHLPLLWLGASGAL